MQTFITLLLVLGTVITLIGTLWFYIEALREGVLWFLLCLVIPLVSLVFLVMHPERALKPTLVNVVGAIFLIGAAMLRRGLAG